MKRWILFLMVAATAVWFWKRPSTSPEAIEAEDLPAALRRDESAKAARPQETRQAPNSTPAAETVSLADDTSGEAPQLVFESSTGSGENDLGVGNEAQDARGPIAFAVSNSGRMAIADGLNHRLQFRDASGRVVKNVVFSEESILRHVTSDDNGRFHALETTPSGQIMVRVFDENGEAVSKVAVKTQDSFLTYAINAYRVEVGAGGHTDLVSMNDSYRIQADGSLKKLPGVPFKNNENQFARLDSDSSGRRVLSIVDAQGRVAGRAPLNNSYMSVAAIHTDARNNAYVQYDTILESAPLSEGDAPIRSRVAVIEGYTAAGAKVGSLMADLDGSHEIDNAFVQDRKTGDFYMATAGKKSVRMTRMSLSGT